MTLTIRNNKRIIKNTIVLYIKLIVTTIIGLYTSRFVLSALGVSDFGLYAVIGGIVSIMNFLGSVMTTTSYRFITVEFGKQEKGNPCQIYNTIRVIHIALAIILLITGETIGTYYVENYLNINANKIPDALFVLHWSIITAMVSIIAIPSNGLIIANEKFLFTSIIEIIRSFLKLGFVILLTYYIGNRLRLYSIITFIYMSIVPICTILYCQIKEPIITKWKISYNKSDYKKVFSFASWTMLGAGSTLAQGQGIAIILNYFFTTVVNAAFGLASQVNGYVMMIVRNLGQAAVPQIIKNYSKGDSQHSLSLVYHISKYSFLIILFPAIPCILCMNTILKLWLEYVPQYTSSFAILMIISNLFWCISTGFDSAIQASGKIKKYQTIFSLINISCIPIGILLFLANYPPYYITIYIIFTNFLLLLLQIYILKELKCFKMKEYWQITLKPSIKVLLFLIPLFLLRNYWGDSNSDMIIIIILSIIYIGITEYYIGLNNDEKRTIMKSIKKTRI